MSEPKFVVGNHVHYSPDITQDRKSGGRFEVVWQMPFEGVEHRYRIRNADGVERIAPEHQLDEVPVG
jgi:hypothetical protein